MNNNLKNQNLFLISLHRQSLLNSYDKYMKKPISLKILKNFKIDKMKLNRKNTRIWSIINTKENYNVWENIKVNDMIMFIQGKYFFSRTKVITKLEYNIENNNLKNNIEFSSKSNLILILEKANKIKLGYNVCIPTLIDPKMPNAYFFSIAKINSMKINSLISIFGNLENALEFLANSEKKNYPISNYLKDDEFLMQVPYDIKMELKKKRIGQQQFRKNVLTNFNNKCAVCGIDDIVLLEAAHIIPIKNIRLAGKINNGICLCSNCHKLFDNGLFSFDDDYKVIISKRERISNTILVTIKNRKIGKFRIAPARGYIGLHRAKYDIGAD